MGGNRKSVRCSDVDYENGTFFITFCTLNMSCILSAIEPGNATPTLFTAGTYVDDAVKYVNDNVEGADIIEYAIMPNHVHILITVDNVDVCGIVRRIKTYSSKKTGKKLWQRSFHDHKVRGEADGKDIRKYIRNNPLKWVLDKYYEPCS